MTTLPPGKYTFVVRTTRRRNGFQLKGPGVNKKTSVKGTGRSTWTVTLKKGKYGYSSISHPKRRQRSRIT